MEETISLFDKIIEEHQTIMQGVQTLEGAANDAEAMAGLEKSKEAFMPGRLEQKQSLQKLQTNMRSLFHLFESQVAIFARFFEPLTNRFWHSWILL